MGLLAGATRAFRYPLLLTVLLVGSLAPGLSAASELAPAQRWAGTVPAVDLQACCKLLVATGLLAEPAGDAEHRAFNLNFEQDSKDKAGLRRDTAYFMGYQFAAVAILYAMPEDVTGWTEEDKSNYSMSKWVNNVKSPQMDSDDFYLNWIIHPYWGGAYFVRARERGYSNSESFWYSTLLSTMFEFGAEALAEEPSYQDLVLTPVLGSFVGVWFMHLRDGVRERTDARGRRATGDKWIWVLTDPLGSLNQQVDKLFGRDADVALRPYLATRVDYDNPWRRPYVVNEEAVVGLSLTLNWN